MQQSSIDQPGAIVASASLLRLHYHSAVPASFNALAQHSSFLAIPLHLLQLYAVQGSLLTCSVLPALQVLASSAGGCWALRCERTGGNRTELSPVHTAVNLVKNHNRQDIGCRRARLGPRRTGPSLASSQVRRLAWQKVEHCPRPFTVRIHQRESLELLRSIVHFIAHFITSDCSVCSLCVHDLRHSQKPFKFFSAKVRLESCETAHIH